MLMQYLQKTTVQLDGMWKEMEKDVKESQILQ